MRRKKDAQGFYPREGAAAAVDGRESPRRGRLCGAAETNHSRAGRWRALLAAARSAAGTIVGRCPLCAAATADPVCAGCRADLADNGPACCPRCASPTRVADLCAGCRRLPPRFDSAFAAFAYESGARDLISAFKFGKRWRLGGALADLTAPYFRGAAAEIAAVDSAARIVLIPIPLHPRREIGRGFNQALEWARKLRPRVFAAGPPSLLAPDLLRRVRATQPQATIDDWRTRIQNVRGAFAVDPRARAEIGRLRENSVFALLDDVVTTGATMNEAARTLRGAGAGKIVAWSVARAGMR